MTKFRSMSNAKIQSSATVPLPLTPPKRILVVISDAKAKNTYTQLLLTQHFEVVAVENGAEGLNMLLTYHPDIILLDLNLPIMDGRVMLHSLRALPQYKATPVIVISDSGDIDTIHQVKAYDNANELFVKANITPEIVINSIKLHS